MNKLFTYLRLIIILTLDYEGSRRICDDNFVMIVFTILLNVLRSSEIIEDVELGGERLIDH